MARFNAFRDGKVHVVREMCSTCIFRGKVVDKERREEMIREADQKETAIVCHSTLNTKQQAVCHAYYQLRSSATLRLAMAMKCIAWDEPKKL